MTPLITIEYLVCPTYLRIVPGRLDVMRFNNLSSKPPDIRSFDLRQSHVIVDMVKGRCIVREAGITTVIPFSFTWHRRSVAYHLLLAALSTHTPAPLPIDELVG